MLKDGESIGDQLLLLLTYKTGPNITRPLPKTVQYGHIIGLQEDTDAKGCLLV